MRQYNKFVSRVVLSLAASLFVGGQVMAETDSVNISATVNGDPAPADTLYVNFNNINPGALGNPALPSITNLDVYAGQINWDAATGTDKTSSPNLLSNMPTTFQNGIANSTGTFSTYCIDITEEIDVNDSYSFTGLTNDLASTPVILSNTFNMGPAAAAIQNLYNNAYDPSSNNNQAAAFQVAIWDIIYGINSNKNSIDVTDTSNRFYISGAPSGVAAAADSLVEAAYAGTNPGQSSLTILALTDAGVQDQLVVGFGIAPGAPFAPTPAAATAGLVLLGGLAIAKRARRVR